VVRKLRLGRMTIKPVLALHLALGVDNDTGIVLKVDEVALLSPPRLALTDYDSRCDCERGLWIRTADVNSGRRSGRQM
jgi:hypothetical protein